MPTKAELQVELANVIRQNGQTGAMLRHVVDLITSKVAHSNSKDIDLELNVTVGDHCVPVYAITLQNSLEMQMNRNEARIKKIMNQLDNEASISNVMDELDKLV